LNNITCLSLFKRLLAKAAGMPEILFPLNPEMSLNLILRETGNRLGYKIVN